MIVVAIIALMAVLAVPAFMRARQRSQAVMVKNDLRLVEAAVEQYAIENGRSPGTTIAVSDWTAYVKPGSRLWETGEDVLGNEFGVQTVDELPMVPLDTYWELGRVADDDFWEPFNP
jgi:type II secretory pathway pseudopilin PulG